MAGLGPVGLLISSPPRTQQPSVLWRYTIEFVTPAKAGAYGWVGMGRASYLRLLPARLHGNRWTGRCN